MRRLSSLAWRSLLARRLRTLLTTAGIALGVGVLFAALLANAAVDASVSRTVDTLMGNAQLRVEAFTESGLTDATQQAVAGTTGVAVAAPRVVRQTYLQPPPGTTTPLRDPVTVLGIDPLRDPQVHPLAPIAGSVLTPGVAEAMISEDLARQDGLSVGSIVTLLGPFSPGQSRFTVSGILSGAGPLRTSGDRIVVIPIASATAIFGLSGVSQIDLLLTPGTSPDTVAASLEARIRTQPYLISEPGDLTASLQASTSDFQATAALIAAISLFVGAFLIFNTLSMTVVERVREVALLRAAGATRGQVHNLVFLQAAILGLVGSVAGLVLGWLLAIWLVGGIAASGGAVGAVPIGSVTVTPASVLLALAVGLVVTIAAAIEPAWRSGRISPIEALRQRPELSRMLAARLRWLLAVFAVVGIAGLLLWPRSTYGVGLTSSLVVYGILLAVTLVSPLILPALGRVAGLPFALVLRAEERLARGTLIRERSRTALTVGSLTIGLAMVVALAAVGQNDRSAADAWIANVVPGNELVTSIRPIAASEGVQQQLAGLAGVARVSPIARFNLAYNGTRIDGAAMPGADLQADGRLTFVSGDRATALGQFDAGGLVLLPKSQADRLGLHLGDHMKFTTEDGGAIDLIVGGVVERSLPGSAGEALLVSWSDATAHFGVIGADSFAVRFTAGSEDRAQALVDATATQLGLQPAPIDAIQGAAGATLDRVFTLFDALAAIAVIVAGLGILNTLTMNVLERIREIGVLRALGMTRRQVWRMVVVEAGILGIVGVVLGLLTGLVVGAVMIALAGGFGGLVTLQIPWAVLALAAIYGIAVAMLAAAYPARVAAGMSIVEAVQFE
jgi:putative ABC transport system permease protein